jgi:predicted O-methyltransferase YrrM
MLSFKDLEELATTSVKSGISSEYLRDLFNKDTTSVYYKYLYNVVNRFKGKGIITVELGTFMGRSTAFLAEANPEGSVTTVDLAPKEEFKNVEAKYDNITSYLGRSDSQELLDMFKEESVDICYFDTEHEYEVVSKEVEVWYPKIKKGGIMLFDDVHMNPGMKKFWEELPYEKGFSDDLHWTGFGYAIK